MALTNKDGHNDNYKELFAELVKERFDEIKDFKWFQNIKFPKNCFKDYQ